jgi:hypothetical protein
MPRGKSLVPKGGNDVVYTPQDLADRIVKHFQPTGVILEPCAGKGAFVRAIKDFTGRLPLECEITKGKDFFHFSSKVDWIITNPPWSQARKFAQHAYTLANDVVFLITVNHFTALRARFIDMERAGFAIREIALVDTPPLPWPQSGFQLGAIHLQHGYRARTGFTRL